MAAAAGVVVVVAVSGPAGAFATQSGAGACARRHAVKRTSEARLFEATTPHGRELSGCAGATGKPVALAYLPTQTDVQYLFFALAGHFAAISQGVLDDKEPNGYATVTVFDLRTRARLLVHDVPGQAGVADRVLLTKAGQAAWIEGDNAAPLLVTPDGQHSAASSVLVFDQRALRVVGSGLEIDASSLRLRGRVLSWTQAGIARSYTLI